MSRVVRIWDWPIRVFHFCFAAGWIGALAIALLSSKLGSTFAYHSLIGLALAWMVVLRLIWGFAGTRHARFGAFAFGPRRVLKYFRDALRFRETRFMGHNPGSAWVIFAMIALTLAQVFTGIAVGSGKKNLRPLHEWLAYAMIALIVAHLLGVALHTLRHREWIALSMIDGKRVGPVEDSIRLSRPLVGAAAALLIAGFSYGIYRNYDPVRQATTLPLIGVEVQIGDSEEDWD
ncbi:MAG: cytochrome b/b6 domain-containing protein [Phycisphaeraceae bacterium]|nr:cytochrome b/b6 domain-containing protein [Phycisphaeraceae bacterium]